MIYSALRYGRISPLLWFGRDGGVRRRLTIWPHQDRFIKMKPTFYYALVSGLLRFGLLTHRPLFKQVLGTRSGADEPGLEET